MGLFHHILNDTIISLQYAMAFAAFVFMIVVPAAVGMSESLKELEHAITIPALFRAFVSVIFVVMALTPFIALALY